MTKQCLAVTYYVPLSDALSLPGSKSLPLPVLAGSSARHVLVCDYPASNNTST